VTALLQFLFGPDSTITQLPALPISSRLRQTARQQNESQTIWADLSAFFLHPAQAPTTRPAASCLLETWQRCASTTCVTW
jgi:hypothetical protein